MDSNNRQKYIFFLSIIIALLIGILVYILFFNKDENLKPINDILNNEVNNNKLNEQLDSTHNNELFYEIRSDNSNGQSLLYINGKLFNELDWDMYEKDNIYQINDILVLSVCTSSCETFFVNKNANIIGSIGDTYMVKTKSIINPKFEQYTVNKVDNKDIYVESISFTYQDGTSLCDFKDNDIVEVVEKYTYIGNGEFTEGTLISSQTTKDILDSNDRFSCD